MNFTEKFKAVKIGTDLKNIKTYEISNIEKNPNLQINGYSSNIVSLLNKYDYVNQGHIYKVLNCEKDKTIKESIFIKIYK